MIPMIKPGDLLSCPICNKAFKATEDTVYIAKGGYTCSWKCFLEHGKELREAKKRGVKE